MRKIEFKFWNKKENKMIRVDEGGFYRKAFLHENGFNQTVNLGIMLSLDFMVPLQSTGLKDCKSDFIFEGDIVSCFVSKKTFRVHWDDYGMFIFTEVGSSSGGVDYHELEEMICKDAFVIVGNIYENPELLGGLK